MGGSLHRDRTAHSGVEVSNLLPEACLEVLLADLASDSIRGESIQGRVSVRYKESADADETKVETDLTSVSSLCTLSKNWRQICLRKSSSLCAKLCGHRCAHEIVSNDCDELPEDQVHHGHTDT